MTYCTGGHTKFFHRFHIVWITKYRYKVLHGEMRERLRETIRRPVLRWARRSSRAFRQRITYASGAFDSDVAYQGALFAQDPDRISDLRKLYWGKRFWARGYCSTTSGNVTDEVILQYLDLHSKRKPTGIRRW